MSEEELEQLKRDVGLIAVCLRGLMMDYAAGSQCDRLLRIADRNLPKHTPEDERR